MTVLVINSGSSSLKYQLVELETGRALAKGLVERIGEEASQAEHTVDGQTVESGEPIADHAAAMRQMARMFEEHGPSLASAGLKAVGHRVVHGGKAIDGPRLVDDALVAEVERLVPLAPLHNPAAATGMRAARALLPDLPHVAVFDTAFFHHLPDAAATYAIDREVAERYRVRRYGFHGTSHDYVSALAGEVLGVGREALRMVVLHLGNGASASAVMHGRPVDTSMGMTPLEGLVMGTRTGDLDPAVVFHLSRQAGLGTDEIDTLLNKRSGLKGLAGENDMRVLSQRREAGDAQAALAIDVYVHRLVKYIGAYAAVMGGLDALVFTAGVGENSPLIRSLVTDRLGFLGLALDPALNETRGQGARVVSPQGQAASVLVVPTNEELAIARQAAALAGR